MAESVVDLGGSLGLGFFMQWKQLVLRGVLGEGSLKLEVCLLLLRTNRSAVIRALK
jgi:hypothetical protein